MKNKSPSSNQQKAFKNQEFFSEKKQFYTEPIPSNNKQKEQMGSNSRMIEQIIAQNVAPNINSPHRNLRIRTMKSETEK